MATITPAVVEGFLRALYAEQAAGGDFWKSGGFDFPIEFRKVEERIRAFLAIAFQGTKAAIFSPEELAALEARRKDLDAALRGDWANVNLAGAPAAPAAPAAQTPNVCAQLAARTAELLPQMRGRIEKYSVAVKAADHFSDVAQRLRESGRAALTDAELSSAVLQADAAVYGLPVSPEMRDSPYTFYLMLARAARDRADRLKNEQLEHPGTIEYASLQWQRIQNNCPKEPEP